MIDRFEIISHGSPRPRADRIIFCDGSGGSLYRADTDLELSHWRPNRTPAEYRAGTSTEICYRFLEKLPSGRWTVAVNNHVDVDGILSVYALLESEYALAHRETIIQAAEMGDFWGWGEPPAQRVFQGITHLMQQYSGADSSAIYAESFRRIPALIDGVDPLGETSQIEQSLAPLREGVEHVAQARILRSPIEDRLVHYVVPFPVAGDDDARASYAPDFNEAISRQAVLWPQVRARWDTERVCLVSVERRIGWFHDLWFPGYLWADTAGRWLVPGMTYHDGMASYDLKHDRLVAAMKELQHDEPGRGLWGLGGTSLPFGAELQKRFPLVGRFLDDQGEPAVSGLPADRVARAFQGVFV